MRIIIKSIKHFTLYVLRARKSYGVKKNIATSNRAVCVLSVVFLTCDQPDAGREGMITGYSFSSCTIQPLLIVNNFHSCVELFIRLIFFG